jgi:menaquinone-specific isochorismate synthase
MLITTTRAIAPFDPLATWSRGPVTNRALWLRPDSNEAIVGIGCAWESGCRFSAANDEWSALLEDAEIDDPIRERGTGPLLIGGFRFDPLRPPTSLWTGLNADRLVLPEQIFVRRGAKAWLTTNRVLKPSISSQDEQLLAPPAMGLEPRAWESLVERVARGIRQAELGVEKVVLARAVELETAIGPRATLRQLAENYPTCTIFAIGHGDTTFLGATPERLVTVHDGVASTMALAGSTGRGRDAIEDRELAGGLLHSPKERAEHDFVVQALRRGLAEVSTRVVAEAEPRVRSLANLQHLLTPIRGQLASGKNILDALAHLHPSPAVGGVPSDEALRLIREREHLDRGWYGGPVGWLDRRGEGDFVVGIRSALLRGSHATLFAGCGIVAESDPAAELAESMWKLRPMLSALGADVADAA